MPRMSEQGCPWYAGAEWFDLLAREGWGASVPTPLQVMHPEAARLPLVAAGSAGHWQGLSNYYTPLLERVDGSALQDAPGLALAWRKAGAAVLDLRPLDAEAPWVVELRDALRAAGFWVAELPAFGNWVLDVRGQSSADYLAARPGPLRTSLQRGRARLSRSGSWSMAVLTEADEALERALDAYEQVYASSWKPTEPTPGFIRSLARRMAARGQLRLGILSLESKALAAQIWFVEDGVAYIFKLAHLDGQEAFSPGSLLTAHLMAHVIDEDKVWSVDFISGDDAYKQDWMSRRRQRLALVAFSKTHVRGAWAALRHFGGDWLKGKRGD